MVAPECLPENMMVVSLPSPDTDSFHMERGQRP